MAVSIYLILLPQIFALLFAAVAYFYDLPKFPSRYVMYLVVNFFRPRPEVSQWLADVNRVYMLFEIGIASLSFAFFCCVVWLLWILKIKEKTVIHRGTRVDTVEMQKAIKNFK